MLAPPDQFLPLVRRHGLMGSVTQLVIGKALDDARSWHRAGADVSVAVNLFAPSVANVDLPETIAHALADHGLRPSALTVEITEELFMDSTERTRTVLEELRHNGIRIAIDDFGSGYSALSYLRDLPIDEVKLDRTFIASILIDQRAAAVVRAVVDLAHVLGVDGRCGRRRRRTDRGIGARTRLRYRPGLFSTRFRYRRTSCWKWSRLPFPVLCRGPALLT